MDQQYCKPTFLNISAEKREKILSVATHEFSQNGFENTNINVIAKKAGVSVGSLYKYFDTKRELFLTVVQMGIGQLQQTLNLIYESEEPILAKLESVIRSIQQTSRGSELIRLYGGISAQENTGMAREIARAMEGVSAGVYTGLIRQGQERGEIRSDIDAAMAAFMIDNLFMSLQFSYACDYYEERFRVYAGGDIFDQDDYVVRQTILFVKSALKKQEE